MARKRSSNATTADGRYDRNRARSRARRRRIVRTFAKLVFWTLVLAATFVFGLGFGKTIANDEKVARGTVKVTQDRGPITATLPTTTVTEVRTVTVVKRPAAKTRPGTKRAPGASQGT